MKIFIVLFGIIVGIALTHCSSVYQKQFVSSQRALCLDGSRAAYYLAKGDPTKILIFFQGGGLCGSYDLPSTIETCYQRSKTDLGSSTGYPSSLTFSTGILSSDGDNYFSNFTKVFLKYCDGSAHQGSRFDPIMYKGAQLFFRGHDITLDTLEDLNKAMGIFKGTVHQLVVSGESIGGLAAFQWTNYFQNRITSETRFRSIPDSGISIDAQNIKSGQYKRRLFFQNIMKLSNQDIGSPIPECNKDHEDEPWKCMFIQYIHPYVTRTPIFLAQSLYDAFYLSVYVGIQCLEGTSLRACSAKDREVMEVYREQTMDVILEVLGNNDNGAWAISCSNHCYLSNAKYDSFSYRVPQGSDYTLIQAVSEWMEDKQGSHKHMDYVAWPINQPCSAL